MITIQSSGRLANKLNYFVTGMFIHEMTGMHFIPEKIDGFVNTYTSLPGIYIQEQIRMSSISDSIDKVENFFQNLNQILYTGSNGKIERGFIVDNMIN
jgi:hypothetical protein